MMITIWHRADKILRVDDHLRWKPETVDTRYYWDDHPEKVIKDADWLIIKPPADWDGKISDWIILGGEAGDSTRLRRREDYEIDCEIERAKEEAILDLIEPQVSKKARKRINQLRRKHEDKRRTRII